MGYTFGAAVGQAFAEKDEMPDFWDNALKAGKKATLIHCFPRKPETSQTSNVGPDIGRRGRHSGSDGQSGSDNQVS